MAKTEVKMVSLLLLFLMLTVSFTVVNGYGTMVGGRTEINDVKTNKEVQEVGRFSVEEYNKIQQAGSLRRSSSNGGGMEEMVFSQVVEAQKQVVSGIKYFLKIEAMQNGLSKTFESVVVVKPGVQSKELLKFSPSIQ